jgi:serine/threonine-protein kinase
VQSRVRSLRVELEGLRQRPLPPPLAARVGPLLARLALAAGVLGDPAERLDHDARSGNHLGVARCVAAGLPEAVVTQRREAFLRERPGAAAAAQQCRARARVARAVGNREVALAQYEEALRADPLDLEVQREYWQVRRESGGAAR